MPIKHQTFFICGTDTGVGKTTVTGILLKNFNDTGIRAGGFKPLESGCRSHQHHLKRADSEHLKKMGKMDDPINRINPYAFKEALAPGVAAERENKKISFTKIKNCLKQLQKKYDLVLIEGAGGLLVPVAGKKTNVDLIRYLGAPVIIVARLGLGTINHTLLTLHHLQHHKIPVAGVILNETSPLKTIAEKTNPDVLKKFKIPILGIVPYLKSSG